MSPTQHVQALAAGARNEVVVAAALLGGGPGRKDREGVTYRDEGMGW